MDTVLKIDEIVIDASDVRRLAKFYTELTGWSIEQDYGNFARLKSPDCDVRIGIQYCEGYKRTDWPEKDAGVHLDFSAGTKENMDKLVQKAESLGAVKCEEQYDEKWTVMQDPDGNPFCIVTHW